MNNLERVLVLKKKVRVPLDPVASARLEIMLKYYRRSDPTLTPCELMELVVHHFYVNTFIPFAEGEVDYFE